jgi:hypothetical protein
MHLALFLKAGCYNRVSPKQEKKKHNNNTKKAYHWGTLSLKWLSQLRMGASISQNDVDALHKCMGMLLNSEVISNLSRLVAVYL